MKNNNVLFYSFFQQNRLFYPVNAYNIYKKNNKKEQ